MVKQTESNLIREFKGTVIEITREKETDKFPAQYAFLIKAVDHPDWEIMRTWVSIPKTSTNESVPKMSMLGVFTQRAEAWGLTGETHQEVIYKMKDKTFMWKDENPKVDGEYIVKKDKLFPQVLVK